MCGPNALIDHITPQAGKASLSSPGATGAPVALIASGANPTAIQTFLGHSKILTIC